MLSNNYNKSCPISVEKNSISDTFFVSQNTSQN